MLQLKVTGMSCGHCIKAVTSAIHQLDPAAKVEVDLATGRVTVTSAIDPGRAVRAIEDQGYDAEVVQALA